LCYKHTDSPTKLYSMLTKRVIGHLRGRNTIPDPNSLCGF
jgi:hypothetical protein